MYKNNVQNKYLLVLYIDRSTSRRVLNMTPKIYTVKKFAITDGDFNFQQAKSTAKYGTLRRTLRRRTLQSKAHCKAKHTANYSSLSALCFKSMCAIGQKYCSIDVQDKYLTKQVSTPMYSTVQWMYKTSIYLVCTLILDNKVTRKVFTSFVRWSVK